MYLYFIHLSITTVTYGKLVLKITRIRRTFSSHYVSSWMREACERLLHAFHLPPFTNDITLLQFYAFGRFFLNSFSSSAVIFPDLSKISSVASRFSPSSPSLLPSYRKLFGKLGMKGIVGLAISSSKSWWRRAYRKIVNTLSIMGCDHTIHIVGLLINRR